MRVQEGGKVVVTSKWGWVDMAGEGGGRGCWFSLNYIFINFNVSREFSILLMFLCHMG